MNNDKVEKVGLVFGGFAPLHRGHLDVIYRAKHYCDKVLLVVCSNNEERDQILRPDTRFQLIDKNFKSDVITVTQLKTAFPERTEETWKMWIESLCDIFSEFCNQFPNMTLASIFMSEPKYISKFSEYQEMWAERLNQGKNNKVSVEYASVTRRWNVHAAQCRENPLKYWDYIHPVFRRFFTHKILIAGASSAGKTTLIHDLANYYAIPASNEVARQFQYPGVQVEWDFEKILHNIKGQKDLNDECMGSFANPGFFLSDSDMVTTMMYAQLCLSAPSPSITQEQYDILYKVVEEYSKFVKWDKIFLIQPVNKPLQNDGFRFMQYDDYQMQQNLFSLQCQLYTQLGYDYEVIHGSYEDLFQAVSQYINTTHEEALHR